MRLFIALILLAFPIAEIVLLVQLADAYGWWLLVYLVVIGYLGLQLIKGEKLLMAPRMMQSLAGGNPIKALMGTARNMVAGVMLLIPGVITDVIAVILLLIPLEQSKPKMQSDAKQGAYRGQRYQQSANDEVIEGEFTHIREDLEKK